MTRIQVALDDKTLSQRLCGALAACQAGHVEGVEDPDMRVPGVVVIDTEHLERMATPLARPERCVLVAHGSRGATPDLMSRAWESGVRAVVFDKDPLDTLVLAVLSARFRKEASRS
jgi:fructose/tagatose bisphosphate aldolase